MNERKRLLIAGGAGYVGSHTNAHVAAQGFDTIVLDNLGNGHRDLCRWGQLVEGDVRDAALLEQVFGRYRIDAVMHFCAFAYVGESMRDPAGYYDNNVCGTITLLNAMMRHGVRELVLSSTCATFGNPQRPRIDETHPQQPISPYGRSKLMIEMLLPDYEAAYGIRAVALRYFNAAGAHPDAPIGERHDPETHLIPLALSAAAGDGAPLCVFGDDYPTPDGTCIRDYIHVCDLAAAHARALSWLASGNPSASFNLGTGRGHSVREVLRAVERVTGKPVPHRIVPRRPGDPAELVADPTRAKEQLGWAPEWIDIEAIIASAWNWYKRRP